MTDEIDRKFAELTKSHATELEWAAVLAAPAGHIFIDRMENDVRFIIMKAHFALSAYLGVPDTHPLAGCDYDAIQDINVHGGWTFAGRGSRWPDGWWFFGWDYAHFNDYTAIAEAHPEVPFIRSLPGHKWTVPDVEADSRETIAAFQQFARERGF
jgi:hypothetical protein